MSETGSARFAGRFLDPSLIARTYRDPLAWLSLATDLVPIAAILVFGWGATPLVALYWLENLIIGAYTVLRLGGAAVVSFINLATALFMIPSSVSAITHCWLDGTTRSVSSGASRFRRST